MLLILPSDMRMWYTHDQVGPSSKVQCQLAYFVSLCVASWIVQSFQNSEEQDASAGYQAAQLRRSCWKHPDDTAGPETPLESGPVHLA